LEPGFGKTGFWNRVLAKPGFGTGFWQNRVLEPGFRKTGFWNRVFVKPGFGTGFSQTRLQIGFWARVWFLLSSYTRRETAPGCHTASSRARLRLLFAVLPAASAEPRQASCVKLTQASAKCECGRQAGRLAGWQAGRQEHRQVCRGRRERTQRQNDP
jgi:hypothetical protein